MHPTHHQVFRNTLENLLVIGKTLGNPATIGLALLAKSLDQDPWASIQEIAELVDVSEDTVRRRVNSLVSISRVDCKGDGGRKLYRIRPSCAQQILGRMKWDHTKLGEAPQPQIAVANCN